MLATSSGFYFTFTLGNRIEIWMSPSMDDFYNCRKSVVWQPQAGSPWSADIWAPELHYLKGAWYIYTCAAPPGVGNAGHRTVLLRSSLQDPMDPAGWQFLGPIPGMPDNWAIDATVFSPDGQELYCCWSGWPPGDTSDTQQDLFLIKMRRPEEAIEGTSICISHAELPWERPDGGRRGVNEGPTWVNTPAFRGIVYSAHGSWTSEYKLALLAFVGGDPLRPEHWVKRSTPLLISDRGKGGPFGPGHASFITSPVPGDSRVFCVYHATANEGEGWSNRKARVIALGPECFTPTAHPICCATGGSHVKDPLHSFGSRIQEKAPPEVRKWLNKAKKFF